MIGKAIAGTVVVHGTGVRIVSEKVVCHYSRFSTNSEPEFRELVGIELEEIWPGGIQTARITWQVQC